MSLRIELKPHEKLLINGAVIANGPKRTQFSVLNAAQILREKEILTETTADSPCKRIYLALQLIYMDNESSARERYLAVLRDLVHDVLSAAPSMAVYCREIQDNLASGDVYQALRSARKLINHESELIRNAEQSP